MENEDKQPLIDEHNRQLEALFKQGGLTADRILSYAKLRISANERLTLLTSGVLTLTFSGAVSLYSRTDLHLSAEVLRPLLGAWKLLILAIICCILANSREERAASIHDGDLLATELWSRTTALKALANRLTPNGSLQAQAPPKTTNNGRIHENIAAIAGWLARVSTVIAFVLMYLFVRSLIVQL